MSAIAAALPAAASKQEVILGRQPIFDRNLEIHGYELLHRTVGRLAASFEDADTASAEVITTGFTDIGLFNVIDRGLAYINMTLEFLASRELMALPADRVAFECPGSDEVTDEFLEVLQDYRAEGYRLVLDGGRVQPENLAALKQVQAVKIDVQTLGLEDAVRQAELLAPLQRDVIAYRVEKVDEYRALEAQGVSYFQGYFFAQPRIVSGTRISSNKLTTLRLLAALHAPETSVEDVSTLVAQDAGPSCKLMRFMNSAFLALPGKIDSIQRAVVFLGLAAIKRWASVMVIASVDDKPSELTRMLLDRARMCESLCQKSEQDDPGAAFTVGLFSGLDALIDRPLVEALEEMPLSEDLKLALNEGSGVLGEAPACARNYEAGEWFSIEFKGLDAAEIGMVSEESVARASQAMQGI